MSFNIKIMGLPLWSNMKVMEHHFKTKLIFKFFFFYCTTIIHSAWGINEANAYLMLLA